MISVPPWVAGLIGAVVTFFGVYRLYIGVKPRPKQAEQKGLYGMPAYRHVMFGIVFIIMGGMLMLSAFGVHVIPSAQPPAPDKPAPMEIDTATQ